MARIKKLTAKQEQAAAETAAREAEAIKVALAWPTVPCPEPLSEAEMDALYEEAKSNGRTVATAYGYTAGSERVEQGCFNSVHHSKFRTDETTTQSRGGPWFLTQQDAEIALLWDVSKRYAENLRKLTLRLIPTKP